MSDEKDLVTMSRPALIALVRQQAAGLAAVDQQLDKWERELEVAHDVAVKHRSNAERITQERDGLRLDHDALRDLYGKLQVEHDLHVRRCDELQAALDERNRQFDHVSEIATGLEQRIVSLNEQLARAEGRAEEENKHCLDARALLQMKNTELDLVKKALAATDKRVDALACEVASTVAKLGFTIHERDEALAKITQRDRDIKPLQGTVKTQFDELDRLQGCCNNLEATLRASKDSFKNLEGELRSNKDKAFNFEAELRRSRCDVEAMSQTVEKYRGASCRLVMIVNRMRAVCDSARHLCGILPVSRLEQAGGAVPGFWDALQALGGTVEDLKKAGEPLEDARKRLDALEKVAVCARQIVGSQRVWLKVSRAAQDKGTPLDPWPTTLLATEDAIIKLDGFDKLPSAEIDQAKAGEEFIKEVAADPKDLETVAECPTCQHVPHVVIDPYTDRCGNCGHIGLKLVTHPKGYYREHWPLNATYDPSMPPG
jgi:chromosome segregation ATPase